MAKRTTYVDARDYDMLRIEGLNDKQIAKALHVSQTAISIFLKERYEKAKQKAKAKKVEGETKWMSFRSVNQ